MKIYNINITKEFENTAKFILRYGKSMLIIHKTKTQGILSI